ncbi:inverted repeat-binding protein [Anticarsia gemmatalis]|uniref:inverted repeat-binding protein n=1 Tax=Anticarsia gemmatalis TaxID=129554 RepID=UPI003F7701EF
MDSEDEIEATPSWKGVPATIICINTYDAKGKSADLAVAATCRMIRQCLRISGTDLIGVCFYGTEVSNTTSLSLNSVEEVFPLKLPTLDDYRKLYNFDMSSLQQAQDLILSEVLLYCSRAFASCKKQLSSRNIVLLSRLDVPPVQLDQRPAYNRVIDLTNSNIDVKLINISEEEYKIDSFYNDFLIEVYKKDDIVLPKPVWDTKEIEQMIYQQSHRHLAVARLSFEIGEGLAIGVGVYTLLKSNSQTYKKVDLDRDTNEILTSVNKTMKVTMKDEKMDVDDEELESKPVPVLKSEILYYKIYGGEKVEFTDDEMKTLKNPFGPPMLKLLGFKPASIMCKEKWFLKSCYFLFPNEGIIEGSISAFKALYKACVKTNVVALCVLCTRVNAKPIIVALSPSTNPLGLDVEVGFDVIRVPFIENVRQLPVLHEDDDVKISDVNKNVMNDILKDLKFDYKPNMFENPKVQKLYRAVESKALDEDEEEPFIDTTKPDAERFQNIKYDIFQDIFGPFGPVAVKKAASSRESKKESGPSSKKAKLEIDETLLQQRLDDGKVKAYTVVELKEILNSKSIDDLPALTGMKKNDLVDLVYKHFK